MPRGTSKNPMRGRGTKMRGAGAKSFKVPTTKTVKPIKPGKQPGTQL